MAAAAVRQGSIALNNFVGRYGESVVQGVNLVKTRIPSLTATASYRIPDIFNAGQRFLGDVKNVEVLKYSSQMRDFVLFGRQYGYTVKYYVRLKTVLQPEVEALYLAGEIEIVRLAELINPFLK